MSCINAHIVKFVHGLEEGDCLAWPRQLRQDSIKGLQRDVSLSFKVGLELASSIEAEASLQLSVTGNFH